MKDVQCYELFGGIALKNHAFYFFPFQSIGLSIEIDAISIFLFHISDIKKRVFRCYSSEKLIALNTISFF